MRADRLLSLLLLLQNRGRMTAGQLAAELEVSVRTVQRDARALLTAGVPLCADRGPEGGYRLMHGYRTRLTGLTRDEAGALFLAALPGPARELGLGAVLSAAQLKLSAALPESAAENSRRVRERFHLDAPAWFREADPVPHLATVARAVWEQRVLRVCYRRARGEVRRELEPLGVVLKGGIWYAVARSGESTRTYRVARFCTVELGAELFVRPPDFGLSAYWETSTRRLESALRRETALLLLSPQALALLPALFGAAGTRATAAAGPPDGDGRVRTELEVEARPVAVGDLLRLGDGAEVLGPPGLREAVAQTVAALAERYGAGH